ncbi:hypothetical protein ACH49M_31145 [Rhodococcus qingshengii]|jgi:hypothetical protein|nr:hypothetical protein [Rhodococcus qingshengii]MBP1054882.1 hypothetical protein [Rhodococcus qingshengii]NHP18494.1 hypothetical protein [Rhodococcus sp. IC4_135]REK80086.1 hypothetical protein DVG80_11465 [Rhodococcus erythropolis]UGQ55661.1 hypothetical protein LRL17_32715 [Rhodococcus qingshengii]
MDEMTVHDAAAALAVTERQVTRLARAGTITITREVGKSLLLSSASVHRIAQTTRRRGRPWNPDVAWAALALLSHRTVDWISPPEQITRLKHRLRRSNADEVAYLARNRATTHHMDTWDGDADALIRDGHLAATGVSAIIHVPERAARFGLSSTLGDKADGYIVDDAFEDIVEQFGMLSPDGDVTLRVVTALNPFFDTTTLPIAAVAVDLMESLDTRERSAGTRVLQELLDDFR